MTHVEEVFEAVRRLVKSKKVFSRTDVREELGLEQEVWDASYSPSFQGMRIDHPGGAPAVTENFRNVFERVGYNQYKLTEYGKGLL